VKCDDVPHSMFWFTRKGNSGCDRTHSATQEETTYGPTKTRGTYGSDHEHINEGSGRAVQECMGGEMCEIACPVGAITVNPDEQVAIKCDLCKGLEEPQCVKYCYTEALRYLPGERGGTVLARAKSAKFLEMVTKEA